MSDIAVSVVVDLDQVREGLARAGGDDVGVEGGVGDVGLHVAMESASFSHGTVKISIQRCRLREDLFYVCFQQQSTGLTRSRILGFARIASSVLCVRVQLISNTGSSGDCFKAVIFVNWSVIMILRSSVSA